MGDRVRRIATQLGLDQPIILVLIINGQRCEPSSGEYADVINPATGDVVGRAVYNAQKTSFVTRQRRSNCESPV